MHLFKENTINCYDSINPVCKTCNGTCLHKETFLFIQALEADGNFFRELLFLKIKLLAKAISAPDSCLQLTKIIKSLKIDPRKTLIEYYAIQVKESLNTPEEFAEINSLIPADIIPTDTLNHL